MFLESWKSNLLMQEVLFFFLFGVPLNILELRCMCNKHKKQRSEVAQTERNAVEHVHTNQDRQAWSKMQFKHLQVQPS